MIVRLDITDCKTQDEIDAKIESNYPYMGYMPIVKGKEVRAGKTYVVLDCLNGN